MAVEIERKFLVADAGIIRSMEGVALSQGYLARGGGATVRVRVAGERGYLTVKGRSDGISRSEYEYPVPRADALAMLEEFCAGRRVEKTRYLVAHGGHQWEVDVFHGENSGLVLAEIELDSVDETFARPDWLGVEVSGDPRYYNSALVEHPYHRW